MQQTLEKKLIDIIERDPWMIDVLKTVRDLNLNDSWVGAGFVRNKIWDEKHGRDRTAFNDIDVIYFDKLNATPKCDLRIERKLVKINSNLKWSIKNQSRMHIRNGQNQYYDCYEAISFWPETATSVAIRLNSESNIECIAPYGLEDLFNLIVKRTPNFNLAVYNERIKKKKWKENWPYLDIKNS